MKGRNSLISFGAALACAGLFGCGGGGGGGGGPTGLTPPPSTPIAITAANISQVADASLAPSVGGTGAFGASSSAAAPESNSRALLRAMQAVSTQAKKPRSSSGLSDAPDDGACSVSGSVTITSSGTSSSIRFNNCSDSVGQSINGFVSATGVNETATTYAASFSVDITFTETGSQTLRLVGNFSISETCDALGNNCTGTFSGSSLGAAHGAEVWFVSSFSITSVENGGFTDVTASYTVSSSDLNGSVQVSTSGPIRFVTGATYPQSGVINVTGAANSSARITINNSNPVDTNAVQVQVDANGDAVFETTNSYSWNQLEAI
jgi:hypothetical protein